MLDPIKEKVIGQISTVTIKMGLFSDKFDLYITVEIENSNEDGIISL